MKPFVYFALFLLVFGGGFVWYSTNAPGSAGRPPSAQLTSDEQDLVDRLRTHVQTLSRDIGSRPVSSASKLNTAQQYIEGEFHQMRLPMQADIIQASNKSSVNLIAEVHGTKPNEIVLVGANYDSAQGCPGADGNASGVAVAIELARRMADTTPERTLRFVFFTMSQEPFAGRPGQGAAQYGKKCAERKENIVAAFVLDGLGIFSDKPDSQSAPFPYCFSYPSKGDFLAFVGDFNSRDLMRQSVSLFRSANRLGAQGCTVPTIMPGFGDSDAGALSDTGARAVLVTDTGSLRAGEYGTPSDTSDRLDYASMARATTGLAVVIGASLRGTLGVP